MLSDTAPLSMSQLEAIATHWEKASREGGVWQAICAADVPTLLSAYESQCQRLAECYVLLDRFARHYGSGVAGKLLAEHNAFDWHNRVLEKELIATTEDA